MSDEVFAGLPLTCLPFGEPQLIRNIVLLERQDRRGGRLAAALADAVKDAKEKALIVGARPLSGRNVKLRGRAAAAAAAGARGRRTPAVRSS